MLKAAKLLVVLFSLLAIVDVAVTSHLGVLERFVGSETNELKDVKSTSVMVLVGFSSETSNADRHSSLAYVLIPRAVDWPSVIYIHKPASGEVTYDRGNNIYAIVSIVLLLLGLYLVGIHAFSLFSGIRRRRVHSVSEEP